MPTMPSPTCLSLLLSPVSVSVSVSVSVYLALCCIDCIDSIDRGRVLAGEGNVIRGSMTLASCRNSDEGGGLWGGDRGGCT